MVAFKETVDCNPLVSIGMPVYNGEEYLEEALACLLNQGYSNFELIISDNASVDATQNLCRAFAETDKRIRYLRQAENIGPLANFQLVLSQSSGKYFMWAAHDDRWHPDFIERLVAVLEDDPGYGLVFSNYIVRNLDTGAEILHRVSPSDSLSPFRNYLMRIIRMCPSMIYGLYRREIMDKKILRESFDYADVHFVAELALRHRIKVVDDFLYVAGTKGERQPYSVSHRKIDRLTFIGKQRELVFSRFSFPVASVLFFVVCSVMIYNKIRLWRY